MIQLTMKTSENKIEACRKLIEKAGEKNINNEKVAGKIRYSKTLDIRVFI